MRAETDPATGMQAGAAARQVPPGTTGARYRNKVLPDFWATEPAREFRRPSCLSHAAKSVCSVRRWYAEFALAGTILRGTDERQGGPNGV